MSIWNDDRRFSDDPKAYREWKQEVNYEYRKEEAYDNERERDRDDD